MSQSIRVELRLVGECQTDLGIIRIAPPHQGLGNQLIDGVPERDAGTVRRRERLGGLLGSYYREAA